MMARPPLTLRLGAALAMIAAPLLLIAALYVQRIAPEGLGMAIGPLDQWGMGSLALALYVFGYAVRRGAPLFAVLAFVFIMGGAAQLYMTDSLWFPNLRLRPTDPGEWAAIGFLGLEAVVALAVLARLNPAWVLAGAMTRFGIGRIVVFLALTAGFAVPILGYLDHGTLPSYLLHVAAGGALMALHLLVLVEMALVKSPMSGANRTAPIVPAVLTVLAALLLSYFAFQQMPHVEDEAAYLFQARTFATGHLTLPAPPEAAQPGLEYYLLEIRDGRWFSSTLPGWPAVLAVGVLIGAPWLLNPIFAGISVLLAYDITRRRAGTEAGDMVALLMATSPWLLAAAASLMPHTLTLMLILFAWWSILRSEDTGQSRARAMVLAGLAMGLIFAARPMDGLVMGSLTGLWVVTGRGRNWLRAAQYVFGCVVVGGLLLAYNAHITGNPLLLPLTDYLNRSWGVGANAYGFGPEIGPPGGWRSLDLWQGHSALEAVLNTINSLTSLQFEMLGWPVGSLALIFAYLLWQRKKGGFDLAMALVAVVVIVVMALYWFADTYYMGPRYWFVAAFPFFYLAVRGYQAIRARVAEEGGVGIDAALVICCCFGMAVFTPWRGVTKYYEYSKFYTLFRDEEAKGTFGSNVVLFRKTGDEGSALILNNLRLKGDGPVYLRDTGTMDLKALEEAFPGRRILHYVPNWSPTPR
jgi:hypothetical protein